MILIKRLTAPRNIILFLVFCFLFLLTACGGSSEKEQGGDSEKIKEGSPEEELNSRHTAPAEDPGIILFFGNSLTAGMGVDPQEAFPALIQQKLDSLNLPYEAVNAGLSGETTAAGKNRVNWVLSQQVDIFVLELGANDGLRGVPLEETRKNLQEIIDLVREKNPDTRIVLAGMQIPPNMGREYAEGFKNIYPELARKNDIELIPFLLEEVAGQTALNQQDGIHPTAEGQRILARNVWEVLEPMVLQKSL